MTASAAREQRWNDLSDDFATYLKKVGSIAAPEIRSEEALHEIAKQLMRMNAHLSELCEAVHRVADK